MLVRRRTCSLIKTHPRDSDGSEQTPCVDLRGGAGAAKRLLPVLVPGLHTGGITTYSKVLLVSLMLACRRQVNNNEDTLKRTF